jgi:putative exosortase-associated protein (TIGR04073 family)
MVSRFRFISLIVGAFVLLGFAGRSLAEDSKDCGYFKSVGRKLGRGVANVVTAPFEIIRTPHLVAQDEGEVAGSTVGIIHGIGAAVTRELAGIIEVVTFLVPVPGKFQPLVKPEFIFSHGDWNS